MQRFQHRPSTKSNSSQIETLSPHALVRQDEPFALTHPSAKVSSGFPSIQSKSTVQERDVKYRESIARVHELLDQLDSAVSFDGVSGGFTLDCNGVEVDLQVQPDSEPVFLLSARVGCCEGLGNRSAQMAMRWALELNYMQQATRGGSLALNKRREIVLVFSHPISVMDQAEFNSIVENFLDTRREVSKELYKRVRAYIRKQQRQ